MTVSLQLPLRTRHRQLAASFKSVPAESVPSTLSSEDSENTGSRRTEKSRRRNHILEQRRGGQTPVLRDTLSCLSVCGIGLYLIAQPWHPADTALPTT